MNIKNTLLCLAFLCATPVLAQSPAQPTITITAQGTVTITEATPGFEVHYTTDGSAPTSASALYAAPFVLSASATVKAIAVIIADSAISSQAYTLIPPPPPPPPPPTTFPYVLSASPSNLSFTYQLGTASSSAQQLTVQDSSPCPPPAGVPICNWPVAVSTDVAWLTATPGTTGFVSSVALNTSKLTAAGTFTGNVILTQPRFTNSTIRIPVKVVVSPAVPATHSVSLTWNASVGGTGYNVMRSAVSGGPYAQLALVSNLLYLDTQVLAGTTYFYVLTAVDAANNQSGNSLEVAAVIPTP